MACGAAIALEKKAREAAFVAAGLVFVWAFLRNVPAALAETIYGGAWTSLWKGLVVAAGALAVTTTTRPSPGFTWAGRVTLGGFMVSSGIQHFLFVPFVKTLVPAWIPPSQEFWTYFSAVALIAGGVGVVIPTTTRLAAALSGLMIFLWVLLLHIPRALGAPDAAEARNEWAAVFEALAFSGIAFVLTRVSAPARPRD